jgi:hypothetical protein
MELGDNHAIQVPGNKSLRVSGCMHDGSKCKSTSDFRSSKLTENDVELAILMAIAYRVAPPKLAAE